MVDMDGIRHTGRTTPRHGSTWRAVGAAALTVALAACGARTGAGAGGPHTTGATGTPVPGDTLTVAEQAPANSLDPAKVDTAFVNYTVLAYAPLIYRAPDGALRPGLARSWNYVGTGNRRLDLALRPGARFSDGSPVTAAAVKASLDYAKAAQGNQAHYLAGASIDATGPLTLSITLAAPNPMLPTLLTQAYGIGQIIGPKGLADPSALNPGHPSDGAGAYVLDPTQTIAGDHYTYRANPGYYDVPNRHFKKIVIRVFANQEAALNALRTKQVDVAKGDFTTASEAKSAGLQIVSMPTVWNGLNLIDRDGTVSKPLGDLRVRQAVNYAIDRAAVTRALVGSYGIPTDETVIPGGDGYSAKDADRYPFDQAKARQLLAAAGYPHGFDLPVLAVRFAGIDTMAEAIAGQLKAVGIRVHLTTAGDIQTYVTDETSRHYPAVAVGYGQQPIHLEGQGLFLPAAKVFNAFGTSSADLSARYEQAAAADRATRARLDTGIEEYLVDNAWFAPVSFSPVFYYAQPRIGGLAISPGAPVATPLDWYALA